MKQKTSTVNFALLGIKTEQFAIIDENYNSRKATDFGTKLEFKLDEINKQIGIFFDVEFVQGKKVFIKIIVSCHFMIDEESWKKMESSKDFKIIISRDFLTHICMITVGTARGVLFAKTEGTEFSNYIIPTIDLTLMITEDAVFELNKK